MNVGQQRHPLSQASEPKHCRILQHCSLSHVCTPSAPAQVMECAHLFKSQQKAQVLAAVKGDEKYKASLNCCHLAAVLVVCTGAACLAASRGRRQQLHRVAWLHRMRSILTLRCPTCAARRRCDGRILRQQLW